MTMQYLPSHLSQDVSKEVFIFQKTKLAGIVLLSALVVTGCDTSENKDSNVDGNNAVATDGNSGSEQVNLTAVGPNAQEYCTDEKLKAVVQQEIETRISEQAESNAKIRSEKSTLRFNATNASDKVQNLIVDVSGIKAAASQNGGTTVTCEAQLTVSIPQKDLDKADTRYAYNKKSSFDERAIAANLTFNEKELTETIMFSIEAQPAVPVVKTNVDIKTIDVVSDVLAASATQDRKNIVVAAARKRAEQARKEKARRAEQARKEKIRRAEQARQAQQKPKQATSTTSSKTTSSLSRGSNTSIEATPKVSDVAPPVLKVPDAENVQLEITQGEDTY